MKLCNVIRNLRKQQGLTQEQIADYLGISTPAVNKWEKGNTYPDITLLPALARLLKTDLNTLLSFNDDLSDVEIEIIEKAVLKVIHEKGYDEGFKTAIQKIREYPTCDLLIITLSDLLENMLSLVKEREPYKNELERLYERISKSENEEIRSEAIYKLSSRYIERGDLEQAEKLIESLQGTKYDNKIRIANLYLQQDYYEKSSAILEHKLLELLTDMQAVLVGMTKIAAKENRMEDAQQLADVCEQITLQFDFMDCTAYIAQLEYATDVQDTDKCIAVLEKLISTMKKKWDISNSLFFRQHKTEHLKAANSYKEHLLPVIIQGLETEKELDFLRENEDFLKMIERLKKLVPYNI